jgi:hypothetical protein
MAKIDIRLHVHNGDGLVFIVASVAKDDRIVSRVNFEIEADPSTSGELAYQVVMNTAEWIALEIANALRTDTPKPKDN